MDGPLTPVILDNGTGSIKAGFGGEDAPRVELPTLVGRSRHPGVSGIMLGRDTDNFVGEDAVENKGIVEDTNPLTRGIITSWDEMENMWHRAFAVRLQIPSEEHPLLITEQPDNTRADREKMAQILFESFACPALVISNVLALTLFATGRSTGMVVDSGASRTHVGPVWEGYCQPHYVRRLNVGGRDLTDSLFSQLRARGYPFSTERDWDTANNIKESQCYVAQDLQKELEYAGRSRTLERMYQLPDNEHVFMNEDRFTCPEGLFDPSRLGYDTLSKSGIHSIVHESLMCCDESVQSELFGAVVLGGGNTLFPKLDERLQRSLAPLAPKDANARVIAFPNRKYSGWIGGSILGSLATFPTMWISKTEYDDFGASIVHRKC